MKHFTPLFLLLVVFGLVESYAHSYEKQLSEVGRKRLLVNVLHALRKLRDHKKEKSTDAALHNFNDEHSDRQRHVEASTPITSNIGGVQILRPNNQISKRSKGIKQGSKETYSTKPKNGNELFLQLLQTLKNIRKRKSKKQRQRTYSSRNHETQPPKLTKKSKNSFPSTLLQQHERNQITEFDQRSSILKPVKQLAKIGTGQTNKARYSFAQARLSFLQALENAQDEKLTKLGNLEKKFSYILPKGENDIRHSVRKEVQYALQDYTKDESATTLSQIHQPYKKLFSTTSESTNPLKHSLSGKPALKKEKTFSQEPKSSSLLSVPTATQNEQENNGNFTAKVDLTSTNRRKFSKTTENHSKQKPKEMFPSMMDELLSIRNARNKLEKLKRLQKLQVKLLHHFSKEGTKKRDHENTLPDNDDESMTSGSHNTELNKPITRNVGIPLFHIVKHKELINASNMSNYNNSLKIVNDMTNKRYNKLQSFQNDGKDFSLHTHSLSGKDSFKNQEHIKKPVGEITDTFEDFVGSPENRKEPIHSTFTHTKTRHKSINGSHSKMDYTNHKSFGNQSTFGNSLESNYRNTQERTVKAHLSGIPMKTNPKHLRYERPLGHESKTTYFPGTVRNNSIKTTQKQRTKHLDNRIQDIIRNPLMPHDINIIGNSSHQYLSSKNQTTTETDQSYLPLDSSAIAPQVKSKDSTNPLHSVLSENEKIISELKASKTLAKHLSNDKNEKSHKRLSKILQKAQNIFLEKVKEILAGRKKNGEKSESNPTGDENRQNARQKPKEGVINTSAYVMDESSSPEKTSPNASQGNSGIVPKTPTNDLLLNSLNGNMETPTAQLQNSGPNPPMGSLPQLPINPNSPVQMQSMGQPEQGHPVAGQPLSYTQQQEAHEEEKIALEQENAFRGTQIGANSPLNAGATTPYQRYVGSNQLPQTNHYTIGNPEFHASNVDDLSEYRGGMERYQLSHQLGYGGNMDDENEDDDYLPRRNHFHPYEHRDDDEEDYDDDEDDDDIDEGKKKSSIGKPRHDAKNRHLKKMHFRYAPSSTEKEHIKHE